jgi:hypothetical protein
METMSIDRYGLSRVIGEKGVLPQRARRLEPSLPCREAELLIDVESLNIDAASFKQIKDEVGAEPARIAARNPCSPGRDYFQGWRRDVKASIAKDEIKLQLSEPVLLEEGSCGYADEARMILGEDREE